jgi:hypothetical protein
MKQRKEHVNVREVALGPPNTKQYCSFMQRFSYVYANFIYPGGGSLEEVVRQEMIFDSIYKNREGLFI